MSRRLRTSAAECGDPNVFCSGGEISKTLTGIDVLEADHFGALAKVADEHGGHLTLGLLTNQTGLDREGRRTVDVLADGAAEGGAGGKAGGDVFAGAWDLREAGFVRM